ncbi:MAG: polyphosphate polymerase domain-containing protein [Clostridiales bacterium]|jgi:hypothetical protein|nr:polyphosphate polymerase domain-containing protein [Clostridiales bacterium]
MKRYTSTFERCEKKYILSAVQHAQILSALTDYTTSDEYGKTDIYTIYYDTPDYLLIRRSIEKPVFKEKLRLRTYGMPTDADTAFIEIKRKYNKIVYKRRIAMPYRKALTFLQMPAKGGQIAKEIEYMLHLYPHLQPAMAMTFNRISFAGREDPALRITFDSNICWRTCPIDLSIPAAGVPLLDEGQRLMEIKLFGAIPLWLSHLLNQNACYPVSFSKYGRAYEAMLKQNANSTLERNYI